MKISNFDLDNKVFIIAELSANHGNDKQIALDTIKAAKEAGADAIKVQTYTADTITLDCKNDYFKINHGTIWDGKYLYDLYNEAYMPWEWQEDLKNYAESLGLIFFSSPFDKTAVDFLETIKVPAYKIASFEIVDIPLIEYIASKGKPIIISTGIAKFEDITEAVEACKRVGNNDIILLKCTSEYPALPEDANLATIPNLKKEFNVTSGLSDHTLGSTVAVAAVALGARVIEKHFIIDKSIGGADASFSLDKNEFKSMVDAIRIVEKSIGNIDYRLTDKKKESRKFSRSLFIVENVKAGEIITESNVRSIRPANGMPPKFLKDVLGKKFNHDYKKGTPLNWDHIE